MTALDWDAIVDGAQERVLFPPGSVGEILSNEQLAGIGGIQRFDIRPSFREAVLERFSFHFVVDLPGGALELQDSWGSSAVHPLVLPLHPEWRERVEAVLADAAAQRQADPTLRLSNLADDIANVMLPPLLRPGSLLCWGGADAIHFLRGEAPSLLTAIHDGQTWSLNISVADPPPLVRASGNRAMEIVVEARNDTGAVNERLEVPGYLYFRADDYFLPAPSDELREHLERLRQLWRTSAQERFEAWLGSHRSPLDPPATLDVLGAIAYVIEHGPPAPEPPPPLRWTEEGLARVAALVRRHDGGSAPNEAAFAFDDFVIRLRATHSYSDLSADEIHLSRGDDSVLLMIADPWNPAAKFAIDGDDRVFEVFTDWLAAVLKRADLDVELSFDASDEDDEEAQPIRLSTWLAFALAEPAVDYDHRLKHRKVSTIPWPQNRVLCRANLSEVPALQRRGTALYREFLQRFIT